MVTTHLRYDKRGTGWGRGDAIWACDNKRGNCTDFHSLLIGMARSVGIPAKRDYFFGALDSNRVRLSVGRDVTL